MISLKIGITFRRSLQVVIRQKNYQNARYDCGDKFSEKNIYFFRYVTALKLHGLNLEMQFSTQFGSIGRIRPTFGEHVRIPNALMEQILSIV